MKTRLLIIIGIVVALGITSFVYVTLFQNQCESLLDDISFPRPLTLQNCLHYLEISEDDEPQSPSDCRMKYGKVYPDIQICMVNLPAGIVSPHIKSKTNPDFKDDTYKSSIGPKIEGKFAEEICSVVGDDCLPYYWGNFQNDGSIMVAITRWDANTNTEKSFIFTIKNDTLSYTVRENEN